MLMVSPIHKDNSNLEIHQMGLLGQMELYQICWNSHKLTKGNPGPGKILQ